MLIKTNSTVNLVSQDGTTIRDGSLKNLHKYRRCDYARMKVPYVPLNRWVNVSFVLDNKFAQLFFDGELRKVVDITQKELIENKDITTPPTGKCTDTDPCNCAENECCGGPENKRTFVLESGKKIYAGKNAGSSIANAFLSQLRFFNYAITLDHAEVLYKTGPLHSSILDSIGLPMYGVRNPFYKIGEDEDTE